ncbi:hypothetical protein CBS101457_000198 [Exobasidium rhododendri]|nr:hypothetical protein CBS101457_000198 [Exobasidium rhododendri]
MTSRKAWLVVSIVHVCVLSLALATPMDGEDWNHGSMGDLGRINTGRSRSRQSSLTGARTSRPDRRYHRDNDGSHTSRSAGRYDTIGEGNVNDVEHINPHRQRTRSFNRTSQVYSENAAHVGDSHVPPMSSFSDQTYGQSDGSEAGGSSYHTGQGSGSSHPAGSYDYQGAHYSSANPSFHGEFGDPGIPSLLDNMGSQTHPWYTPYDDSQYKNTGHENRWQYQQPTMIYSETMQALNLAAPSPTHQQTYSDSFSPLESTPVDYSLLGQFTSDFAPPQRASPPPPYDGDSSTAPLRQNADQHAPSYSASLPTASSTHTDDAARASPPPEGLHNIPPSSEYLLQIDPNFEVPDDGGYITSHLSDRQKLVMYDRIAQVRPFGHSTIVYNMQNYLTVPIARALLSYDQRENDGAAQMFLPCREARHNEAGDGFGTWMYRLDNVKRREVVRRVSIATLQNVDKLRDLFLKSNMKPTVAQKILQARYLEEVQSIAEEEDLILPPGDEDAAEDKKNVRMPWKKGLTTLQRSALHQRIDGHFTIEWKKLYRLLGKNRVPPGYGLMLLHAGDAKFAMMVDELQSRAKSLQITTFDEL